MQLVIFSESVYSVEVVVTGHRHDLKRIGSDRKTT